jgi:hypothetical protein
MGGGGGGGENRRFRLKYLPRTAIKEQMLADFMAEFTPVSGQEIPNIPTCDQELIEDTSLWRL